MADEAIEIEWYMLMRRLWTKFPAFGRWLCRWNIQHDALNSVCPRCGEFIEYAPSQIGDR